ncbi:MAG: cysteine desulfurase IscS [Candidatus Sericytochromatia bacterium]|nr:MAG: cysteine desulfurase IscS [Candidatus Sericytochromatia bacterium]
MKKNIIYLDNHSTTPVDSRIADKVLHYMINEFGNPSSITHSYSDSALEAIEISKNYISDLLNCGNSKIIFTSGATESINIAILGFVKYLKNKKDKIKLVILPLEHKAVITTCKKLSKDKEIELYFLKVDKKGCIDLNYLEDLCKNSIDMVCIMAANNEIGNIYPLKDIGNITNKYNVKFFCDATQAVGKINIDFINTKIDILCFSGHKMYAPKGIGGLILKEDIKLEPIFYGGGQQNGLRPGTLNVSGIVGLGYACYLRKNEMEEDEKRIEKLRNKMLDNLIENFQDIVINGDINNKLAGNISISIPGILNQDIIKKVRDHIAISTGSACSSGFENPSHVLTAMNLPDDVINGTIRIGLGKFNTEEEIDKATDILVETIKSLKKSL